MISIVVPIYNKEKTLERCLDSIVQQSNQDFEVIMVDDGSTDGSASICKEFEKKDDRFIYIYQENKGVSGARNKGIELARGNYITFIDSDDIVLPNHLNCELRTTLSLYVRGVMICNVEGGTLPSFNNCENSKEKTIIGKEKIIDYYFMDLPEMHNTYYSVVNKFFSRQIILSYNIRFHEGINVGEDLIFICDFFKHIESVHFCSNRTYVICCYMDGNSLTQQKRNAMDNFYYVIQIFKALHSLYIDSKSPVLRRFQYNYLFTRLYTKIAKPLVKKILHR